MTLGFEREPAHVAADAILRDRCETFVARDGDAVVGLVSAARRRLHVGGEATACGFLDQGRVARSHDGRGLVAMGLRAVCARLTETGVPGAYATVSEGHRAAEGVLLRHHGRGPVGLVPVAELRTLAYAATAVRPRRRQGVLATATADDLTGGRRLPDPPPTAARRHRTGSVAFVRRLARASTVRAQKRREVPVPATLGRMRTFAYGSDLDPDQSTERCPSTACVRRALLPDIDLGFTRWSTRRHCGVADVVPQPGGRVLGVGYVMSEADGRLLDGFEGYLPRRAENGYAPVERTVAIDGDPTRALGVTTYEVLARSSLRFALDADDLGHLLRGPARWGLPDAYQARLRSIVTAPGAA